MQDSELTFKVFSEDEYEEYKAWFEFSYLSRTLYSIDEEWLKHIKTDKTGIEYAVFQNKKLIAVIGIVLPTAQENYFIISNIATHPDKLRTGLASQTISMLFSMHPLSMGQGWKAYVEKKNTVAYNFFKSTQWIDSTIDSDEMFVFIYDKSN